MDLQTIKQVIASVLPMSKQEGDAEKKKTVGGTFHIGALSGNRLNSGTLRSQFFVCESESDWNNSSAREALHSDQRVFVQTGDDIWDVYSGTNLNSESKPIIVAQGQPGLQDLLTTAKAELLPSMPAIANAPNNGSFPRPDILAAIRTKPFILLAGISGTGKSRMVRQLARGCCPRYKDGSTTEDHPLYNEQKPRNFEMIQVRPNWHDSTELMGYVTRITEDDKPRYVLTDFVRFLAWAWLFPDVPFFLCLDEMNLAPVEQYFAEYLSVIETRRKEGVKVATDVLVKLDKEIRKATLDRLFEDVDHGDAQPLIDRFDDEGGIPIPPNLVVMGTVNMDETTCTFSRKVLDRAMSFELNEVKMREGLGGGEDKVDPIPPAAALASRLKPGDFYAGNEAVCDAAIGFLEAVNDVLGKTPFKIAYRTRDEVLLYCVERTEGRASLSVALDEAASMKILSRIEGDETAMRLPRGFAAAAGDKDAPRNLLQLLRNTILMKLAEVGGAKFDNGAKPDFAALAKTYPICATKLDEMDDRLATGYTGFWR